MEWKERNGKKGMEGISVFTSIFIRIKRSSSVFISSKCLLSVLVLSFYVLTVLVIV